MVRPNRLFAGGVSLKVENAITQLELVAATGTRGCA